MSIHEIETPEQAEHRRWREQRQRRLAALPKTPWVYEAQRLVAESDDEYVREMSPWPIEEMRLVEADAVAARQSFALLAPAPDHVMGAVWNYWLEEPKQPLRRIFRFSLIGGGQLRTIDHFVPSTRLPHEVLKDFPISHDRTLLLVTPHIGDRLHHYRGVLKEEGCEMQMAAVVLSGPQDVADRVAATLHVIDGQDAFHALLDGAGRCAICRRILRDEVSKLVAVGPDCARLHKIPHSMAAASRRLALRRKLLSERPRL